MTISAANPAVSLIADITDLVSGKLGDYAPLSVEGMTVGGKIFGVPESLKAVEFWYDKSKLPTPPATTDDLLKLETGRHSHRHQLQLLPLLGLLQRLRWSGLR